MNQLLIRLQINANLIQELYEDGAFKRLESGSDREREALAHLLYIVEKNRELITFYGGVITQEAGKL